MYPREDGHCRCYYIPGTIEDEDYPLTAAVKYLHSIGADLRRGDVLRSYSNTELVLGVFNGKEFLPMDKSFASVVVYERYGSTYGLPREFRVIEDGVPINYWTDNETDENTRGITKGSVIWFNHTLVRDDCLENLTAEANSNGTTICTTFHYMGKKYRIIFGAIASNVESPKLVEMGLTLALTTLERDDLIPFKSSGFGYKCSEDMLVLHPCLYKNTES